MSRDYYMLKYRWEGDERYLLWYDGDPDGVVVDDEQRVLSFADPMLLRSCAAEKGISVNEEPPGLHDLDRVRQWSAQRDPATLDCGETLSAWNLFIDVRSSVEQRNVVYDEYEQENDDLYDKLFWGSNPPILTPEGKSYVPLWSRAELIRIGAVIDTGLRYFQAHVRNVDPDYPGPRRQERKGGPATASG
jgi:hypothetical protein